MKIETLPRISRPVIWTLHDMWPFTGGCFYAGDCTRYTDSCGCCPKLGSARENDLSRRIWQRKTAAWGEVPLTLVTPSRWLAKCAAASSLLSGKDIRVIPNGIDTTCYRPLDRFKAREVLNLPQDRQIILFGALGSTGDLRKGFQHLLPSLKLLSESSLGKTSELLVYGSNEPENPPDFGMITRYMGHVRDDETMVLLNSAADVFVAPSIEDNLPNTIMEALACGTPCVAFDIGGMPDMIEHRKNGYLARPFEPTDLAQGIAWVLEDEERRQALSVRARQKVEDEYALEKVARRYVDLYEEILASDAR